ncbi:helix-turn-helix transcriptional regulator [Kribbella albertanoniae]|uniref:XRE family transcriptional regulator n=1 Tax=Kribbella albertanoniae TaxID=1266829 RepID=A0A4R4QII7_9ACTN|nr:helix-turn-helix transcriptional regulator [Kribbella albertanoniae]TDC35474.1 XRE family transcriptional regulator [Kribbella albertanoniae]
MREHNHLGEFIKARRDLLRPADVGLAGPPSLRTTGLRREDLATLAGISADYLSRLEQGRERNPSHRVIKALAEVLHLDAEATEHLHRLAHPQLAVDRSLSEEVNPDLSRMLAAWPDTPAMILGSGLDVLSASPLAAALYAPAGPRPNLLLFTFLNPAAREFYVDWEIVATKAVAGLHAVSSTPCEASARRRALVARLCDESPDFAQMWVKHEVRQPKYDVVRLRHPVVGRLDLAYQTLTVNAAPWQLLHVYQAATGSAAEEALRQLASLAD